MQIEQDGNIVSFSPQEPTVGMIFYPGGKVQCEAYAPLMLACAQRGIFCVLVRMPGNLAVLHPDAADGIPEKYPQIESWYIGGHSLGGPWIFWLLWKAEGRWTADDYKPGAGGTDCGGYFHVYYNEVNRAG